MRRIAEWCCQARGRGRGEARSASGTERLEAGVALSEVVVVAKRGGGGVG